jgi:hypothetical protein
MSTPTSASTSYCTTEQALNFMDSTMIGDLVDDQGQAVTENELLVNTKFQACLDAASGEVEMAALVGERYTPLDLQSLTGVMAVKLQEIVAWLAIPKLLGRRNPALEAYPQVDDAREMLQAIRLGVRIFGLVEAQEAGQMFRIDDASNQTRPMPTSYKLAGRYFGRRSRYLPRTQGNNSDAPM